MKCVKNLQQILSFNIILDLLAKESSVHLCGHVKAEYGDVW